MALNDDGDVAIAWTRDDPRSAVDKIANFVEVTVGHGRRPLLETGTRFRRAIKPPIEEEEEGKKTIIHLNASEPSVAIDPAGDVVVVWRYFDGTNSVIEAAERPAGGTFSRQPEAISSPGVDSAEPEVAIDGSGNAIAVWEELRRDRFGGQSRAASPRRRTSGLPTTISRIGGAR